MMLQSKDYVSLQPVQVPLSTRGDELLSCVSRLGVPVNHNGNTTNSVLKHLLHVAADFKQEPTESMIAFSVFDHRKYSIWVP